MKTEHIYWLRERVLTGHTGAETVALEFSSDSGYGRTPQFFRVPTPDVPQIRALYQSWGGSRAVGTRIGNTVKGPGIPVAPSVQLWRENGNN